MTKKEIAAKKREMKAAVAAAQEAMYAAITAHSELKRAFEAEFPAKPAKRADMPYYEAGRTAVINHGHSW